MSRRAGGFTLVEVMVSIVVLAVGVLALAAGSMIVTRDIGASRATTAAVSMAQSKLDQLRILASSTVPACTSAELASSTAPVVTGRTRLSWTVEGRLASKLIRVMIEYPAAAGIRVDTLVSVVSC